MASYWYHHSLLFLFLHLCPRCTVSTLHHSCPLFCFFVFCFPFFIFFVRVNKHITECNLIERVEFALWQNQTGTNCPAGGVDVAADKVRVPSATEWTASVHTLHMPKAVISLVFKLLLGTCSILVFLRFRVFVFSRFHVLPAAPPAAGTQIPYIIPFLENEITRHVFLTDLHVVFHAEEITRVSHPKSVITGPLIPTLDIGISLWQFSRVHSTRRTLRERSRLSSAERRSFVEVGIHSTWTSTLGRCNKCLQISTFEGHYVVWACVVPSLFIAPVPRLRQRDDLCSSSVEAEAGVGCTFLPHTIQYNTIQYNTIQYNAMQFYHLLIIYPFLTEQRERWRPCREIQGIATCITCYSMRPGQYHLSQSTARPNGCPLPDTTTRNGEANSKE